MGDREGVGDMRVGVRWEGREREICGDCCCYQLDDSESDIRLLFPPDVGE